MGETGADELFVYVVDDDVNWGVEGCCNIFEETTQAKMWLSSNYFMGQVDRNTQERPNLLHFWAKWLNSWDQFAVKTRNMGQYCIL